MQVDNEDDWEDVDDEEDIEMKEGNPEKKSKSKKKAGEDKPSEIWNAEKEPLKEDEELDYDGSAYLMLHRSKVEWPCLSVDFVLRERC